LVEAEVVLGVVEGGSGERCAHWTRRTAKIGCATGLGSLIRWGSLIKG
jgi:hypothetical protein